MEREKLFVADEKKYPQRKTAVNNYAIPEKTRIKIRTKDGENDDNSRKNIQDEADIN